MQIKTRLKPNEIYDTFIMRTKSNKQKYSPYHICKRCGVMKALRRCWCVNGAPYYHTACLHQEKLTLSHIPEEMCAHVCQGTHLRMLISHHSLCQIFIKLELCVIMIISHRGKPRSSRNE